ncbi:MAG TPA: MFS transporter, partial [Acidimicrobiales bacterium]|nr:MFS transporter [Acidimicrobiales bacterium]
MRAEAEAVIPQGQLDEILRPRDGLIAEQPLQGDGHTFEQTDGATRAYRRTVTTDPLGDGQVRVHQVVDFQLGLPYFSWLFALPLRRAVRAVSPPPTQPWWAPPQRLGRRPAVVLATLCALAVVVGYLGGLLSLTMTYAAKEFGVGKTGQGIALGAVRINVVLALGMLMLADRRGRRRLILLTAAGASVLTAFGALAPSLVWLTASQVLAVALVAALVVLIGVMAAEEMPAGSRAWALGVLTMTFGLGAGLATIALPLADRGVGGWRWLYAFGLLFLPLIASASRYLPESRRFTKATSTAEPTPREARDRHRSRLLLLCTGGFLFALFSTPSGQFGNEFLRTERHFSASRISVFSLVCGTIGGLGVLIGGRLADTRGRRVVAAVGVGLGVITALGSYFARGWPLWGWGIADNLLSYAVAPALAVYGPELFPTSLRSRTTGLIAVVYAAGGVIGLIVVGTLSSAIGTIGPALATLAFGPLLLVVLIIR